MTSPEAPVTTRHSREEIAAIIGQKITARKIAKADNLAVTSKNPLPESQHLKPEYVGPEKYTDTDFSDEELITDTELLRPIGKDLANLTTINSYILIINDGAPLTSLQYGQIQNRLLRLQSQGLIARTPVGLYRTNQE